MAAARLMSSAPFALDSFAPPALDSFEGFAPPPAVLPSPSSACSSSSSSAASSTCAARTVALRLATLAEVPLGFPREVSTLCRALGLFRRVGVTDKKWYQRGKPPRPSQLPRGCRRYFFLHFAVSCQPTSS